MPDRSALSGHRGLQQEDEFLLAAEAEDMAADPGPVSAGLVALGWGLRELFYASAELAGFLLRCWDEGRRRG
jgi:hypothetical protein